MSTETQTDQCITHQPAGRFENVATSLMTGLLSGGFWYLFVVFDQDIAATFGFSSLYPYILGWFGVVVSAGMAIAEVLDVFLNRDKIETKPKKIKPREIILDGVRYREVRR